MRITTDRLTEAELATIPCDYCREMMRAINEISPVAALAAGVRMFTRGQVRILAHTAAGHPTN